MQAMRLARPRSPLQLVDEEIPMPRAGEVRVRVTACGVCRTDLHVVDGELPHPKLPLVLGHEIVGKIDAVGEGTEASSLTVGTRVGIPWLAWTCGECNACLRGAENLCKRALFTGYTRDGGYAEYATADARYCFALPDGLDDSHAAPLLCAGLIGYRALRFAGDAAHLGLYGFGAAAHIIAQLAKYQGRTVSAFVRPGDEAARNFALELGVDWADSSEQRPARPLDAALIFAPVGPLVVAALRAIRPGGIVVCAGIHMSDIPSFPYELLWKERRIGSVANLTRRDAEEFLPLAAQAGIRPQITTFSLGQANVALQRLRDGELNGAAVLEM